MSKQFYKHFEFRAAALHTIDLVNGIVSEYIAQGYRLTVRQLYYQLVARGFIENTERSYKRTTGLVNDARLAGLIDWDAIEDRTREFAKRPHWATGNDILHAVAGQYFADMWEGQDARVFVIVEKEALAGVLEGVCHTLDMPLLAARGYPSGTVLREFAKIDLRRCHTEGQGAIILHLGDHDPSGIDMSRDLEERLDMFNEYGVPVTFKRIALNMPQIEEHNPPPNPAKSTDSRFMDYVEKFGEESWELDALAPQYLSKLVEEHTMAHIDMTLWDERRVYIDDVRARLQDTADNF